MRPSDFYGIRDELAAWCFDRAVHLFGISVENDLAAAANSGKKAWQVELARQRVLNKWLGTPVRFRDPGGSGTAAAAEPSEVDSSKASGPVRL